MGVLAHRLCTLDGSARPPIDTNGNLSLHVSAESPLNISPNLSEVISKFRNTRATFQNTPLSAQICHSAG
jgi:hypothetical protein